MGYVYRPDRNFVEAPFWQVGYYKPDGEFVIESAYYDMEEAVYRVHFLNGGSLRKDTVQ